MTIVIKWDTYKLEAIETREFIIAAMKHAVLGRMQLATSFTQVVTDKEIRESIR